MITYKIPLVPGPTSVPMKNREPYLTDFGSTDLEPEFFELLKENCELLREMLYTKNHVSIHSGEGMVVLWGALKSVLKPGEKLLAVSNGIFGSGFADMARAVGAEAEVLLAPDGEFIDKETLAKKLAEYKPDVVTAVHCETPSGLLNPIAEIADVIKESGALFCVDFVASGFGAEVRVDDWGIDLGLLGSQKCLSLLPDLSMITVSERAWKKAEEVGYAGYDALLPWKTAIEDKYMPYTHNWHSMASLNVALKGVKEEGLEKAFARHSEAAAWCRKRIKEMGLRLYAKDEALSSPTVTAVMIPDGWTWEELDTAFREKGLAVGGSYGDLAGKVFRIGHMGSQADMTILTAGLDVIEEVLKTRA